MSRSFLYHIFSRFCMFCATRRRYQVSVYRTIGPLVSQLCLYLGNSQVSVCRTIGPLVMSRGYIHVNFLEKMFA